MTRVEVAPELLRWARKRSGLSESELRERFPKFSAWEQRAVQPTLKQLEDFAKATFTPVGFLFLDAPPVEHVPIPDFRTIRNVHIDHPSPRPGEQDEADVHAQRLLRYGPGPVHGAR